MEYLIKAGLIMCLLPILLIKILSWCEIEVSVMFKEVTVSVLLIGIALLAVGFVYFVITY